MMARAQEGSVQGLYLAAQAGNNGKSHNHNDVGNFIVYSEGMPAIIDVGVETYTAKTFTRNGTKSGPCSRRITTAPLWAG